MNKQSYVLDEEDVLVAFYFILRKKFGIKGHIQLCGEAFIFSYECTEEQQQEIEKMLRGESE